MYFTCFCTSYSLRLTDDTANSGSIPEGSSGLGPGYESDLLRSAYERVANHSDRPSVAEKPNGAGVIPGFKTLQQQQVS